jgi:SAM-dependent methyltransferase
MTIKIDQPGQPGEYDDGMQALLQIVWGDGFLSPGGPAEIARLLEGVDLHGKAVLDIGCGLGAIDVLLVESHGAEHVVGIDLEPDLVAQAKRRVAAAGLEGRIDVRTVDVGPLGFPDASFDVVFSKDSLVQIPDKSAIFAEIRRVLKPGGRFVVSDWLRGGSGPYSAEMLEYFRLEGITYNMASIEQSVGALRAAGFTEVIARDRNDWYLDLARRELESLAGEWYPLIVERIGAARAEHFVVNWRQLVLVLERGELRPAHLLAVSP